MKLKMCRLEMINNIMENRITKLNENVFQSLLKNTNKDLYIFKKILNDDFNFGLFENKDTININDYKYDDNDLNIDYSYPNKETSLVCSTYETDTIGTTYIVLPYKDAFFTIKDKDNYLKGFWSEKVIWLNKFTKNELWTNDKCLLIKKDLFI